MNTTKQSEQEILKGELAERYAAASAETGQSVESLMAEHKDQPLQSQWVSLYQLQRAHMKSREQLERCAANGVFLTDEVRAASIEHLGVEIDAVGLGLLPRLDWLVKHGLSLSTDRGPWGTWGRHANTLTEAETEKLVYYVMLGWVLSGVGGPGDMEAGKELPQLRVSKQFYEGMQEILRVAHVTKGSAQV